jgi:hypothetical protein
VPQGVAAIHRGKQMTQRLIHKQLGLSGLANEIEVRSIASSPPQGDNGEPV